MLFSSYWLTELWRGGLNFLIIRIRWFFTEPADLFSWFSGIYEAAEGLFFTSVTCKYEDLQSSRMLHSLDWYLPTFRHIFKDQAMSRPHVNCGGSLKSLVKWFGLLHCLFLSQLQKMGTTLSLSLHYLWRDTVAPNWWKKIIRHGRPRITVQCTKPFHAPDMPILFPGLLFIRGARPSSEEGEASLK